MRQAYTTGRLSPPDPPGLQFFHRSARTQMRQPCESTRCRTRIPMRTPPQSCLFGGARMGRHWSIISLAHGQLASHIADKSRPWAWNMRLRLKIGVMHLSGLNIFVGPDMNPSSMSVLFAMARKKEPGACWILPWPSRCQHKFALCATLTRIGHTAPGFLSSMA